MTRHDGEIRNVRDQAAATVEGSAAYERVYVSEIKVDDFVPAGVREWTRVCQVDEVGDRVLIYLDEDSVLRDDMPLNFPKTTIWTRRV